MRKHAAPIGNLQDVEPDGTITIEEWDEFGNCHRLQSFAGGVRDIADLRNSIKEIGTTKARTSWIVCLLDGAVLTTNYPRADNEEVTDWLR